MLFKINTAMPLVASLPINREIPIMDLDLMTSIRQELLQRKWNKNTKTTLSSLKRLSTRDILSIMIFRIPELFSYAMGWNLHMRMSYLFLISNIGSNLLVSKSLVFAGNGWIHTSPLLLHRIIISIKSNKFRNGL